MGEKNSKWAPHLGCRIETTRGCRGVLTTLSELAGMNRPAVVGDDDIYVAFYPGARFGEHIQFYPLDEVDVHLVYPDQRVTSVTRGE